VIRLVWDVRPLRENAETFRLERLPDTTEIIFDQPTARTRKFYVAAKRTWLSKLPYA